MATIHRSVEGKRGCGRRDKGGTYLVCDGEGRECGMFPFPLTPCPTCGHKHNHSMGFRWVAGKLFERFAKCASKPKDCLGCPALDLPKMERVGLMWVGASFYTPDSFMKEARRMGVSKKIKHIPRGFEVGKDWIVLAHKDACVAIGEDGATTSPGIFYMFRPTSIDYIYKGTESKSELDALEDKGFRIIDVIADKADADQFELDLGLTKPKAEEKLKDEIGQFLYEKYLREYPDIINLIGSALSQGLSPTEIRKRFDRSAPASIVASLETVAQYMIALMGDDGKE